MRLLDTVRLLGMLEYIQTLMSSQLSAIKVEFQKLKCSSAQKFEMISMGRLLLIWSSHAYHFHFGGIQKQR